MPCSCGTGDETIHAFWCWDHPTPYVFGMTLEPIGRKVRATGRVIPIPTCTKADMGRGARTTPRERS